MSGPDESPPNSLTLEIEDETTRDIPAGRPLLFVALEAGRPTAGGARYDLGGLEEVVIGRGPTRALELGDHPARRVLKLPDKIVSSRHARLIKRGDDWFVEDLGSRNGSKVDGEKITEPALLGERSLVEIGGTFLMLRPRSELTSPSRTLDTERDPKKPLGLGTLLPSYEVALCDLEQIAIVDVPVLLLGETGTGKELIARAIHELSGRSGPFVAVNCGALTETLAHGNLFGHVRGAFSGAATDEPGLIRASHKGTLFLDEIGELSKATQTALLRVLQEREVLPVGGTKPIKVDLRVVSATHRKIEDQSDGSFRADLYARLAGYTLRIPPLRSRREDLGVIIAGILSQPSFARYADLRVSAPLARSFFRHPWPYNARELERLMSVGAALVRDGLLDVQHAPEASLSASGGWPTGKSSPRVPVVREPVELDDASRALRDELLGVLTRSQGNISEASRVMGKTRMQIHRWMKRFGIDPEAFRS